LPEIFIYPNPVENSLTLESNINIPNAQLNIFDQLGRSVLRRDASDVSKVTLDVSNLSSGMYFLRVEGNGLSRSQAVVINH